jgi:lysozyme
MKASDRAIALIQEFEGLATECYADVGGKATIGYGHLIRKGESFTTIDEAEAVRILCADLEDAEACIEASVEVDLTQAQFDALCSFVFNLGCEQFKRSTLLRLLNGGDYTAAAGEFPRWCRVGRNAVPGLLRRRIAEQMLFQSEGAHGTI